ncbi:tetratricopeptide repeat protein [Streptomyces sp. NBC_01171]|uniref:tetratricopeptide repeat protein n=1 Tax=Streptomyces sp. NBC_01171 TaxID=2903757 RepID=UPI00386E0F5B|nr:tetratricopeptide repeat protein [Streptomyces sp. NBC_01171]
MGRRQEQAAFDEALRQPPDEAANFLFHIHGPAGVGKSTLVRQLESAARETSAVTAYVDESVADAIEAMESISAQVSQQGGELKAFDKLLSTYRQRRHEASTSAGEMLAGAAEPGQGNEPPAPSPSSMIGSQLALVGLGMIPGVGAFTGAVDPNQVAARADRFKALLSNRLRSPEDVQLVLSPLQVLTPVFLKGLTEAAARRPWLVLFFDTYERTGPLLDAWLRDILVTERYGQMPANVLVVLAGQPQLDAQCWGDWLDLVTDLPLEVFTDTEARQLLAAKEITDAKVVEAILELSGRLPVLVSTLADAHPSSVTEVGDPSDTAVERFLKWETNPARRAAALACALPQEVDEDVYRTVVEDEQAREEFSWLRTRPFFIHRAGRGHYHDVVRSAMLRLQRQQSPQRWKEQHSALAEAFRQRCRELEGDLSSTDDPWEDERWRGHKLQETYHRLCGDHHAALPAALRELVDAYDHDITTLRRWTQTLSRAGQDADAPLVRKWGRDIAAALEEPQPGAAVLALLLSRGNLDASGQSLVHTIRGWESRRDGDYEQSATEYTRAIELDPTPRAIRGRGEAFRRARRYEEALADLDRAIELEPTVPWALRSRGQTYLAMGRYEAALTEFDRAIEIEPGNKWSIKYRGETFRMAKRYEEALSEFGRAIELDPDDAWSLASRGQTHDQMGMDQEALADYTRAIEIDPTYTWALTNRGIIYRNLKRYEEALADHHRAVEIDPDYKWAYVNRGQTYHATRQHQEALADYTRALEIDPAYAWALTNRGNLHRDLKEYEKALTDYGRAIELGPEDTWPRVNRAQTRHAMGRYEDAVADYTHVIEISPKAWYFLSRGRSHRALARWDEAIADLARAIDLDPATAMLHAERGYVLRLSGRHHEALTHFDRALELAPASPFSLTNRGVTHRLLGHIEEALADLTRAIEIRPEDGWAHYEKAVVLFLSGDQGHENECRRSTELCSSDAGEDDRHRVAARGNLVLVHCLLSAWTDAETHLTAFLHAHPNRGELHELHTVMLTLRDVVPASEEPLSAFAERLRTALEHDQGPVTC